MQGGETSTAGEKKNTKTTQARKTLERVVSRYTSILDSLSPYFSSTVSKLTSISARQGTIYGPKVLTMFMISPNYWDTMKIINAFVRIHMTIRKKSTSEKTKDRENIVINRINYSGR